MTTAFLFRSFGFPLEKPRLRIIAYSQVVETVLPTAFYLSELMYTVAIPLKKKAC